MQRWKKVAAVLEISTFRGTFLSQLRGPKSSTTKLPVELLQNVEGLGQSGSIVHVNHGYARNFLVPNKIAAIKRGKQSGSIAPPELLSSSFDQPAGMRDEAVQEKQEQSSKIENAKEVQSIQKAIKKLTSSTLMIKRKASDTGVLDKPIYAQDVAEAVAKQFQIELVEKMVGMGNECLERVGDYELPLNFYLPGNKRATIDVRVEST